MLSALQMFSIGIGPSSSHTVGPMRAAKRFSDSLVSSGALDRVARIRVDLYGSLALTGKGHGTDRAAFAGLEGLDPRTCDTRSVRTDLARATASGILLLAGKRRILFRASDIVFNMHVSLPLHPNGMHFQAFDAAGNVVSSEVLYSIGGGFIATQDELARQVQAKRKAEGLPPLDLASLVSSTDSDGFRRTGGPSSEEKGKEELETRVRSGSAAGSGPASGSVPKAGVDASHAAIPYDFRTATELVALCESNSLTIPQLVERNELASHTPEELETGLRAAWKTMLLSVCNGVHSTERELPGILHVARRAPKAYEVLRQGAPDVLDGTDRRISLIDGYRGPRRTASDWVDLFALAVNEENAAGGRIVTAPTNGASGVIPAVLHYYWAFLDGDWSGTRDFLLTASAVGYLFKRNASISGAEVGCQGEVGTACSMAAAGLCQVMGGSLEQIENAAEIGIEHNLGLTCDPVAGLVQIPCIERNAVAANTAVNAARLALLGDGSHVVTLDTAIETMRTTGKDMMSKYKETSKGGLAVTVNAPEC